MLIVSVRVILSLQQHPNVRGTMNWVFFAAFIVACKAAKLDRSYLPPASAATAGGSPGSLQVPFAKSQIKKFPAGSFINEHDGVVIELSTAGTRTANSGLGAPRVSYGSMDSKVGESAFRGTTQAHVINPVLDYNPDLSAFHQPSKPARTDTQITRDRGSNIIKYHNDISSDRYSYGFETDTGIKAEEKGAVVNGVQAEGAFSYVGDDGKVYSVAYTADEGGYRPVGSHLPTPPPIPVEILRSLEQNKRDEAAGIFEDGSYDAQKYNANDYMKIDANNQYNDRRTDNFQVQSGSGANANGFFINQNQGAFNKPNSFGSFNGVRPDSSKFSSGMNGFEMNLNTQNKFGGGQTNAGINLGNVFLQTQKLHGSISSNLGSTFIKNNASSSSIAAKPLSQQELQETTSLGQGQAGDNRPSSYDTSLSSVISDKIFSEENRKPNQQIVTDFATELNKNKPINFEQSFMRPMQRLPTYNFDKNTGSKHMTVINIDTVSKLNKPNNSERPLGAYTINENKMTQTSTNRESTLQSGISSSLDQTQLSTEKMSDGSDLFTASKPFMSTKQPERTLTTPLESVSNTNNENLSTFGISQAQYTGSNFANLSGSTTKDLTSKFGAQSSSTQEFFNSKTTPSQFTSTSYNNNDAKITNFPFKLTSQQFSTQNQQSEDKQNKYQTMQSVTTIPTKNINFFQSTQGVGSNEFNKQTQSLFNSHIYNKPSISLNNEVIRLESNISKFPTTTSSQLNTETSSIMESKFTEINKDFSTFSQDTSEFNKYKYFPAPTKTTFLTNKGFQASNGITQASISSFPSVFPTTLNFESSAQTASKPFMQQTTQKDHSQTQTFQPTRLTTGSIQSSSTYQNNIKENSNPQVSLQYENKIYEYNKPPQSFPLAPQGLVENQQVGQFNTQFGATTPFKVKENGFSNQKEQTSFDNREQNEDFDKKTTSSISQASTPQFNDKLTTSSIQNPTDISEMNSENSDPEIASRFEVYEYTKPSQSLTSSSSKEQFDQSIRNTQLSEETDRKSTTAFTGSYTETMENSQTDTTQFDRAEFERKTEMPEFSQTSTSFNEMPTIYQYTKPSQSLLSTSQQENYNNSPFDTQTEQTTEGTMSTQITQQYFSTNNLGVQTFQNRFNSHQTTSSQLTNGNQQTVQQEQTQFINNLSTPIKSMSQQIIGNKFNFQNQGDLGEIYEYKKPNQTSSSTDQMKIILNQGQNAELNSNINSQENLQSNSQSGEIYEYSKPAQTLTTPSQSNILGQKFGQRFDEINSQGSNFNSNLNVDKLLTQNESLMPTSTVTQSDTAQQITSISGGALVTSQGSSTPGINSNFGSRPQFTFHSACCRGYQNRKHQGSGVTQSTLTTENSETTKKQHFETQKLTTPFRQREQFGGPRKPPSFDKKGYHY